MVRVPSQPSQQSPCSKRAEERPELPDTQGANQPSPCSQSGSQNGPQNGPQNDPQGGSHVSVKVQNYISFASVIFHRCKFLFLTKIKFLREKMQFFTANLHGQGGFQCVVR